MMIRGLVGRLRKSGRIMALAAGLAAGMVLSESAGAPASAAESFAFMQAVTAGAADDGAVLEFYRARDFAPLWTADDAAARARRAALLAATRKAGAHGLPVARYDPEAIRADFAMIDSERRRGEVEIRTTRRFLQYATDIHSGVLEPRKVMKELAVDPPRPDRRKLLEDFAASDDPLGFLNALAPRSAEYVRLLKEKRRLERLVAAGGWGPPLRSRALKPGQRGEAVVALRRRLTRMGYRGLGISPLYDAGLQAAVARFQEDNGLNADGVAGPATLKALNVPARTRLEQVIVALERRRWLNRPLGRRHILVNQADFRATVVDEGRPTLTTRVVIGIASARYRTPEFSKDMTHMVVNPTWNVPKSIATSEYLPALKRSPGALGRLGLRMYDVSGRQVDPWNYDFSRYDASNFPFDLKQPPGPGNALGKVKFMFPNRFNIYLHDTPAKSLFAKDIRTYSHGCVRVQKPFELAYTLLAPQSDDPKALFHAVLGTGRETRIDLETPVPVHLTYWTVRVTPEGRVNYRLDTYGRDRVVFRALQQAGVEVTAPEG